jgi:hypothetical protein
MVLRLLDPNASVFTPLLVLVPNAQDTAKYDGYKQDADEHGFHGFSSRSISPNNFVNSLLVGLHWGHLSYGLSL